MVTGNHGLVVAGYIYADYYFRDGLDFFIDRYGSEPFIPKGDRNLVFGNGKVKIVRGTDRYFSDFLGRLETSKGMINKVKAGGGGRNSSSAFERLGVDYTYFDTCLIPSFDTGLSPHSFDKAYFSNMSLPCKSLIIETVNGKGAGTLAVKSSRSDLEVGLTNKSKKKLEKLAEEENDFFLNSISNNELAEVITEKAKSQVYAVVTTYLDREGEPLQKLMKRADTSFFSLDEFYWYRNQIKKANEIKEKGIDKTVAESIYKDISDVADELKIYSPIIVTLGQYGAVFHQKDKRERKGSWVRLNDTSRERIQKDINENGISTNTAGDFFSARVIKGLRSWENVENAIINGCQFAVHDVLGFNHGRVKYEDYIIESLK